MKACLPLLLCILFAADVVKSTQIVFKDNGYGGIVIAINPQVEEDPKLIDSLKTIWTDASKYLFTATKNRAYFRNVTILVPETWTNGTYNSTAQGESYATADVLVADPNPVFGDLPYTLQYGECGKPGQYIHITPDYIKLEKFEFDTGVKGKVIVHEWAHLRWGVFDEVATEGYDSFYLSQKSVEATRCPASLQGLNLVIDYDTGSYYGCPLNENTLLPEPGCMFAPYGVQPDGLHTSLMSHQYLDGVIGFCHSNSSDSINLHNTAAPNEQNRLCNLRSTWDVIMDTEDFANGANPPNNISDTVPTFNVVRSSPSRYVLVMDVSGSMSGNRLAVMQRASSLFVTEYVASGSYVGLVSFQSFGSKLSDLMKIDDISRTELDQIVRATRASGGTGIGSGILTGLEVLKESGTCEGNLIVLTDGQENNPPYVSDVYDEVLRCGVRMYTIFLDLSDVNANKIMTSLSKESGGDWFLASSASSSTDILDIFRKLSQNEDGDKTKKTYQILSNSLTLLPNTAENGTAKIDSSVGNHTLFTFTWVYSMPNVLVIAPSGCVYATYTDPSLKYCLNNPIHEIDNSLRTCKFSIPGTASAGEWIYTIENIYGGEQTFTVTVTSKASSTKIYPIDVESRLALADITSSTPTVVYAKVTQGFSAVLDANVTAIITTPSSNKVTLQLYDKGTGPDVRKNDGIYSRYFYQYGVQGRYSVQVKVSGAPTGKQTQSGGSPAAFNPGIINENGTLELNPNGLANLPNSTIEGTTIDYEFDRVESGGSFSYSGPEDPGDVYAPNRVTDLNGNQLNVTNLEEGIRVAITFTAPGDDLDSGNASSYEIRYSFENGTFLFNNFNESVMIEDSDVIEGNLSSPLPAYSKENVVFKVPNNTNEGSMQLFVGMRSYDDVGNPSDISNILPMTLFFKKAALPELPTTPPTTTPLPDSTAVTSSYFTTERSTDPATTSAAESVTSMQHSFNLLVCQISARMLGGLTLALIVAVITLG